MTSRFDEQAAVHSGIPVPLGTTSAGMTRAAKLQAVWRMMRRRALEGHLPPARQMFEIAYLYLRNGLSPTYYYSGGLYERAIPWRAKREHITTRTYLRRLRRINEPEFRILTQNKVVTAGLLQLFGVRTPTFYGHLITSAGQTFDGRPLRSCDDLGALLSRGEIDRLCFKPITGWGGRGFVKVSVAPGPDGLNVVLEPEGRRIDLQTFWNHCLPEKAGEGYLCQQVVEQHPELARFNPSSVNTIRTMMVRDSDGRWGVRDAWLRMGRGAVAVDNGSMGGITARIDRASGELEAARDICLDFKTFDHHPVTGVPIAGSRIPMWEKVLRSSEQTATVFDYMSWLAIDVALDAAGPLVIEINEQPDPLCQLDARQAWGTLLRELSRQARRVEAARHDR
jgi:hypothetical protein